MAVQPTKRPSIIKATTDVVTAVATLAEMIPNGAIRLAHTGSKLLDVSDMYIDNWIKNKKSDYRSDSLERLQLLKDQIKVAVSLGLLTGNETPEEAIKVLEKLDI